MQEHDSKVAREPRQTVMTNCPQCDTDLTILRVFAGRAGCEYWTMRCPTCGGIHLDIVQASPAPLTA